MFLSPAAKPRRRQTLERSKTATLPVAASVEPKVGRQSFAAAKNQLKKLKQQQAYGDHSIGQKRHTASGALDYSSATQNATPFDPPASKRQAVGSKVQRPVWVSSVSKRASQAEARMSDDEQMDAPSWEFTDGTQDMDTTGADSGSTLLSPYGEPVGYAQLAAAGSLDDALEAPPDVSHVLMQGEKHAVFEVAGFPEAVRQHLGSIDFASVPVSSGVSDEAKFAYVATPTVCLVWSYAGSGRAVNNVYQLAMPDPSSATIFESPIISLVPSSAQQGDVGVIACTATGQLRYWDHIVFGLGGTERFHSKDLGLTDINDQCSEILDVYPGLHVVSTKKGFMYQVTLQNSQGLTELGARLLSKSTGARAGMLSRMSSLLGGSSFDAPVAGSGDSLVGLAAGGRTEIRHSREVYALTHQKLQKWVVSRAYPEKYIYSMDVLEVLSRAAGGSDRC
ncbi:hypothetical protein DL89DRAFT_120522 [Linderina pennispora]|uniref:Nucleoporin Nup133/Nup155-like N-terminal domain-containing protein n=1 Tax=Linderina pennispora TaxID=61395 RepID=A0A1Y1WCJ7_9FUNG|nr:uncharacterized protein DL89DRAFT_120522 [Linderina pennispora]ORX71162.1 hypothetical protein DL89DRAFT_120522 [Linderina pennispora]